MPVEIESHTVSHFKATINATVKPEGLESDGIFISYQARPKIVHLLHKRGFVYSDMHTTVSKLQNLHTEVLRSLKLIVNHVQMPLYDIF